MRVSDAMAKKIVTCHKDEEISKILKKMEDNRIHQLPVLENGKVLGMVFLKDIIRSPRAVKKNTAGQFLTKIPPLKSDSNLQEAVRNIFRLGVRALPVAENGKLVGIISETDLIKYVDFLEDISPHRLMSGKIFAVRETSNLGKTLSIMSEQNVSRVPVVDSQDRAIGCIDNLSLIKFIRWPKESVRFSHLTALEKTSAKSFPAKDYMRETPLMEVSEFSLRKIIDTLQSNEEIIITERKHPVGLITPRDILELALIEEEIPIQIARAEKIDSYNRSRLDDTFRNFVKKIDKIIPVRRFFIYIDTHEAQGGRMKYSLRANFVTEKNNFRASSHGWDIWEAVHMLLENLERQIIKARKKTKTFRAIRRKHKLSQQL